MTDNSPSEDFDYGEKKADGQYENYPTIGEGEFVQDPRSTYIHVDGCGEVTSMMGDLPQSIARNPTFYDETFCSGCGEHVPVEEVEWEDGEDWVVVQRDDLLPRRFKLVRHEDASNTSGTGVVAVGVEYPDGAVHMQWLNDRNDDLDTSSNGVAFKPAPDGVAATEEIHGHGGRTEVVFVDD